MPPALEEWGLNHWTTRESESEVAQSCPTLCDPMDVVYQASSSMGFSRQECQSGLPFPSPREIHKGSPPKMFLKPVKEHLSQILSHHPMLYPMQEIPSNAGDAGSIQGLGRAPGEGNGNPLHYSYWKNTMDRGVRRTTVHRVTKSDTTERLNTILERKSWN